MSGRGRSWIIATNLLRRPSLLLLALIVGPACHAQQTLLQITSPANGTVVNPGQTIAISVNSPSNTSFSGVALIGEDPIGVTAVQNSVPAAFSVTIPTDIDCGPHGLTAVGATSSGQSVASDPIDVDVERPDMPTALSAQMAGGHITLEALGQQFSTLLFAAFSDGSVLQVNQSSYIAFSSSDPTIATVDANGMITAVKAGSAIVTATYTLNGQGVQTQLNVTVRAQVMDVTPTSLDFGSQNVGASAAPQQLTITNQGAGPLRMIAITPPGDFSETDNCISSSPLQPQTTCSINVTFSPTGAGARSGRLVIANGFEVVPASIALNGIGIGQPTTTTALTSSANPSVFGQSVTLTATVSSGTGTPTGSVAFSDGSTALGTVSLNGGIAAFTTSSLSIGTHSITAAYTGNGAFLGSNGALTQVVNPAATTVTVTSSANPSVLNSAVTFTAAVTATVPGAGTPTGNITFKDSSSALATAAMNSAGQATLSTSALAAGAHSLTAAYSGDSNFNGSTSAPLAQIVEYQPVNAQCGGDAGHQILQPIKTDGTSVFKQGQTVPAKFRVCDASGNSIGAAGVVGSFYLTQIVSGTVTTNVQDIVDTNNPDNAFRWDSTNQQWIFNILTRNLAANMTYVYTISLNDGTAINFQFGLK